MPRPQESGQTPTTPTAGGWRLSTYFAALTLAFVLVALAATTYVASQSARDGRNNAADDAAFAARTASGQLGDTAKLLQETVAGLAATPNIANVFKDPASCSLAFSGPPGLDQGHVDVMKSDGTVSCSSKSPGKSPQTSYASAAWLDRAKQGPIFEAPVPEPGTDTHAIVAAAPFKGGIVAAFLTLEPAGVGLVKLLGGGQPVEFLLTTKDGRTVLTRSIAPDRAVGRKIDPIAVGAKDRTASHPDPDGTDRIYAASDVPGAGWRFYAGIDEDAALAESARLRDRQLLIIGVGLAIILGAAFVIYRRVALPVARLGGAVRETSEHVPLRAVATGGPREVAALGTDINGLISSVNRELTERERAEAAALASERNYRMLFGSSPLPAWIYDRETLEILDVNDAATHAYGFDHDAFLALRMPEIAVGEGRHRRRDGSELEVRIAGHDLQFGDRPARVVIAEDVSQREQLERQLRQGQRMEAIGRLAGGIAHDFNNVLTAVLGYSELMLHRMDEDDARRTEVAEIHQAGERGLSLTQQLLTFARGKELETSIFDVNLTVAELEPMLQRLMPPAVEVEVKLGAQTGQIDADRGQIEQVLVNLAVNAGHAMPDGGTLTIRTGVTELREEPVRSHPSVEGNAGRYVVLEVSDTGVGMDRATLAHIFEPFFTTRKDGEGTGLGLATVYGIVKHSGGTIEADSEVGVGTTFTVYLPASHVEAEAPAPDTTEVVGPPSGARVLLVDDDPSVRLLVRSMLDLHDYATVEACDGHEALTVSASMVPDELDLLITDTVVPGPGGQRLAERVRERHPHVRVLVMSGYSDAGSPDPPPGAAPSRFIAKPFTRAALDAALVDVLGPEDDQA